MIALQRTLVARLWLGSFLLLANSLAAQTTLTLTEAITRGLDNNYDIRLARVDLEVANTNDDWALAGRYPTISLNFSNNNNFTNRNDPASIVAIAETSNVGVTPSLNLNWTLFDGYRVRTTKEQFERRVALSEGQLQLQVEATIQAIIQAYYNALVQREQADVLAEVMKLSRDQVDYQEVRREFGQANTFDLLQARDAYLNDSTNYLIQQTTYENALRNLLLVMGEDDPAVNIALADDLTFAPQDFDLSVLEQRLLAANRSLQNLLINRDLANVNTRLAEAAKYPTVGVTAGASYGVTIQNGTLTFDFGNDQPAQERPLPGVAARTLNANIGLSASYLLWDGSARQRRIEAAQLQEIGAQLSYEGQKQNLLILLNNTLETYNNQKELVTLTEERVVNARENLRIAEERLEGGVINSFDYRNIQLNYINATQQRLNAIFNLKNTETELVRLTGGLVRG
jgi:outer membrane protein TolC